MMRPRQYAGPHSTHYKRPYLHYRTADPKWCLYPDTPVAYFPREAWVDAPLLASRLAEFAGEAGADLRFGQSLEAVQTEEGTLRAALLSGSERLPVDAMVNACGPRAAEVSSLAGVPLTLAPKSGLLVRLEVSGQPVSRLMHAEAVNVRPDAGGRVLVHHDSVDEMLWEEPGATDKLAGVLLERARRILPPLEQASVSETPVGVRPIPEDGFPCVGPVPDLGGYYEAVTHSGVTLGPLLGRLLAGEIVGEQPSPLLSAFRAERFARSSGLS